MPFAKLGKKLASISQAKLIVASSSISTITTEESTSSSLEEYPKRNALELIATKSTKSLGCEYKIYAETWRQNLLSVLRLLGLFSRI